jgi:hypothetical protein
VRWRALWRQADADGDHQRDIAVATLVKRRRSGHDESDDRSVAVIVSALTDQVRIRSRGARLTGIHGEIVPLDVHLWKSIAPNRTGRDPDKG